MCRVWIENSRQCRASTNSKGPGAVHIDAITTRIIRKIACRSHAEGLTASTVIRVPKLQSRIGSSSHHVGINFSSLRIPFHLQMSSWPENHIIRTYTQFDMEIVSDLRDLCPTVTAEQASVCKEESQTISLIEKARRLLCDQSHCSVFQAAPEPSMALRCPPVATAPGRQMHA
jgi:hypothetical protein